MQISIITVGNLKEKFWVEAQKEYVKRLGRFSKISVIEVKEEQAPASLSPAEEEQVKEKECAALLNKTDERSFIVAMDPGGKMLDSEGLSGTISKCMVQGSSHITFLIGGSLGLTNDVLKKANMTISLSKMTFPHALARIVLLEQVYRGFKIMNNETYHK